MERGGEAELVGRVIAGKYQIDSFLGGGAMGAVYKAHQRALDKAVAIKVMHKEHAKDPQFAGRFQREAKAASRLDHPNAMRVFDFGEEPDGLLYIAMELLDGRDLFKVIQEDWPLSDERIVGLLGQALGALAVAHDMGVVHRDLKPENIMVLRGNDDEGRPADVVKVCDFGIAKIIDARSDEASRGTAKLTAQGLVIGTPEYMSPEQGRGESLDLRSDLYSMGVILYQLLTGRVPFEAETALGVVLMHVTDQPRPPHEIHPGVNVRLEAACLKALAKKREERFQNAREMRGALREAFGAGAPGTAPPSVDASFGMAPTAAIAAPATGPGPGSASGTGSGSALPGSAPQVVVVATAPTLLGPGGASLGTTAGVASDASPGRRSRAPIAMGVALLALVGVAAAVAPRLFARDDAPAAPASLAPMAAPTPTAASPAPPTVAPPSALAPIARDPISHPAVAAARNEPPRARGGPHGRDPRPPKGGAASATQPPSAPSPPAAPVVEPVVVTPAAPTAAAPTAAAPTAAAPTPAPPGPAVPSPTSFDPALAQVEIARASATSGVSMTKLRVALVRLQPAWTACYRTVLRARGSAASGEATLHLAIDDTGRVTTATLGGAAFLPQVAACIEAPVRGARIPDVDTGDATADVSLTFRLP